jgi:nitrate reductase NapE
MSSRTGQGLEDGSVKKKRELLMFLFLTVVLAPALAVGIVGAYGFTIWIYQLIVGPPGV